MKKVVLAGYYGMHNTGDEAILAATVDALKQVRNDLQITVLSADPEKTSEEYGVKAFHRMWPPGVFAALFGSDLVLFGGGSLLQDVTSRRSLMYYLSILEGARLLSRRVMVYANGIGPVRWPLGRLMVARAVSGADVVTVRDKESAAELRAMGVAEREIVVTADPAFLLQPGSSDEARRTLAREGLEGDNILWLSVRPVASQDWSLRLVSFIGEARKLGLKPAFLLMHRVDDAREAERINRLLVASGHEPVPALNTPGPRDALALIGRGSFLVAMRLHALILAAMAGVPSAGVELDPKVSSFVKAAGFIPVPHPAEAHERALHEALDELCRRSEEMRKALPPKLDEFRKLARKNVDIALSLLDD